jgi:hypothetical protein
MFSEQGEGGLGPARYTRTAGICFLWVSGARGEQNREVGSQSGDTYVGARSLHKKSSNCGLTQDTVVRGTVFSDMSLLSDVPR